MVAVAVDEVLALLDRARAWLLATLRQNRRPDGLLHAYNLIAFDQAGEVTVRRLPPMLEGQVAALVSGVLEPAEAADLLDALAASPLRRQDLGTYLLYPDRELPAFLDRGVVPAAELAASPLLRRLLDRGVDRLLRRDAAGTVRFAPELRNAEVLATECAALGLPPAERDELAAVYERVFDHAAFTGRSGVFFGYEGLGCVYWHMVSKLRLAVLETWLAARAGGAPPQILSRLQRHYLDIRRGLGVDLPPERYGAFPSDPYSHTPAHAGARQPGMTGQVKEDLIARRLELGVQMADGCLRFGPVALHPGAPLTEDWRGALGVAADCAVPAGAVGLSVCGVPVVLRVGGGPHATVQLADGRAVALPDGRLDRELSAAVLARSGLVARIDVRLPLAAATRPAAAAASGSTAPGT